MNYQLSNTLKTYFSYPTMYLYIICYSNGFIECNLRVRSHFSGIIKQYSWRLYTSDSDPFGSSIPIKMFILYATRQHTSYTTVTPLHTTEWHRGRSVESPQASAIIAKQIHSIIFSGTAQQPLANWNHLFDYI